MARQMGDRPIRGTIDGLTFYLHPDDGYLVRAKSSLSTEQVLNQPGFRLFIDRSKEFGEAIYAGDLLRKSISNLLFPVADGKLSSRMNAAMLSVVYSDPVSESGERRFHKGDPGLLKGFEFNIKHEFDDVFTGDYIITRNKTNDELYISIPGFTIASKITAPEYASHFQFIAARAVINFEQGIHKSIIGKTVRLPLNQPATENLQFILPTKPLDGATGFVVLGIVFFGEFKKIPRGVISQRKRDRLKSRKDPEGVVAYTGALKVLKVGKADLSSFSG